MKFQKTKPRYINRFQKPWKYAIWSKYEIGSIRMYRIVSQIWESRHATLISIYFMLQNDFKSIKWKFELIKNVKVGELKGTFTKSATLTFDFMVIKSKFLSLKIQINS